MLLFERAFSFLGEFKRAFYLLSWQLNLTCEKSNVNTHGDHQMIWMPMTHIDGSRI